MQDLKLALVSTGLGNVRRGFEVFFETLFRKLRPVLDVTLLQGGGEEEAGVRRLPNLPRDSGFWKVLGMDERDFWRRYRVEQYSFLPALLCRTWKSGYHILHVSEYHLGRQFLRLGRRLLPRPPAVVLHNGHPLAPEFYRVFDHVQQLSGHCYEAGLAAGIPAARMSVLPIGVDEKVFRPTDGSSFRRRLGIPEDKLLVLSVGALERRKRLDWLIEEAGACPGGLFLLIAGEAGEGDEVREIRGLAEARLKGRVAFVRLGHREMVEAYDAADLTVSCALYEGFGIALVESMAMEVPVFCHHHPSLRWIVGDGGRPMDMEKKGELGGWLRQALENRQELEEIGKRGRERVLAEFSWDVLVPRYVRMYEHIRASLPR